MPSPMISQGSVASSLSGSPYSVKLKYAFRLDVQELISRGLPILGICYGAQLISHELGGQVQKSETREYGRTHLQLHGHGSGISC